MQRLEIEQLWLDELQPELAQLSVLVDRARGTAGAGLGHDFIMEAVAWNGVANSHTRHELAIHIAEIVVARLSEDPLARTNLRAVLEPVWERAVTLWRRLCQASVTLTGAFATLRPKVPDAILSKLTRLANSEFRVYQHCVREITTSLDEHELCHLPAILNQVEFHRPSGAWAIAEVDILDWVMPPWLMRLQANDASGDLEWALDELWKQLIAEVWATNRGGLESMIGRSGAGGESADIVSEAYFECVRVRSKRKFFEVDRPHLEPFTFASMVCNGVLRTAQRKWVRRTRATTGDDTDASLVRPVVSAGFSIDEAWPDDALTPSSQAVKDEGTARFWRLLDGNAKGLSDHNRQLLHEIFFEGKSQDQIAQERGLKPGTIHNQSSEARKRLAELLRAEFDS